MSTSHLHSQADDYYALVTSLVAILNHCLNAYKLGHHEIESYKHSHHPQSPIPYVRISARQDAIQSILTQTRLQIHRVDKQLPQVCDKLEFLLDACTRARKNVIGRYKMSDVDAFNADTAKGALGGLVEVRALCKSEWGRLSNAFREAFGVDMAHNRNSRQKKAPPRGTLTPPETPKSGRSWLFSKTPSQGTMTPPKTPTESKSKTPTESKSKSKSKTPSRRKLW
ncbi:hypothetical protein DFH27DRAFT_609783 [Peziza echinospora]|nr:hypothetical protein DFH27DRAFT_609783 [Peziza echinospora]